MDPALEVGQTFFDPDGGTTITTEWTDAGGATVSVSFGGAPSCVHTNPEIGLTPATIWAEPGTPVTYTVTVTNRDGTACNNTSFDLPAAVPAGWTATFGTASLTLAPGASGTTTLAVTSPVSAADGFYEVAVTAENGADPAFTASASATYVVSAAVNQPPVAGDDSAATAEDTPVTIPVLANDSDPDGDPLTVISIAQGAGGLAVLNPDGTVTYTPNPGFTGTGGFGYTVSDGQGGSASATVTVTVNGTVNAPPVAQDDNGNTQTNAPVTIPVLANDSDPDGDPLTVVAAAQGAKGRVTVNGDGTITYTPNSKAKGSDNFTYTISDGANLASATVTVKMWKNGGGNGKGNGRNK